MQTSPATATAEANSTARQRRPGARPSGNHKSINGARATAGNRVHSASQEAIGPPGHDPGCATYVCSAHTVVATNTALDAPTSENSQASRPGSRCRTVAPSTGNDNASTTETPTSPVANTCQVRPSCTATITAATVSAVVHTASSQDLR